MLAYALARLLLVAVLTAVIFGGAHLLGVRDFPLVIALLFAIVIALPLGIWIFAPLRNAPPRASRRSTSGDVRIASSCRPGCAAKNRRQSDGSRGA